MTTRKTRVKTNAAEFIPADRHQVDAAIAQIGEAQRARENLTVCMNAELAEIKRKYEEEAAPHAAVISTMQKGIQIYCEANRMDLTKDGRTKTVRFGAGEVSWRMRPRAVTIRGAEAVVKLLKKLGLTDFVRTKEEVDKTKILAAPDAEALLEGVTGISIGQGEDFVVKPFASEIEEVS